MAEIILVRHGQASFGKANYDKLSELGIQQSQWLGEHLATNNAEVDSIWRGDMVRHKETADGIVQGLNQVSANYAHIDEIGVYPGLNEFDFKAVADAFVTLYPDEKPEANAKPEVFYRLLRKSMLSWSEGELNDSTLPESWSEFQSRVMAVLEAAIASPHKRILMATSGGAIAMMISQVVGANAATMVNLNLQIRNTSVSRLFANQSGAHLHQFNAIPHLETPSKLSAISYS
ncbi:histidine phosphatase family protein [Alteromonas facilis]|uniref:histidine phosphatase family protein n=1 Tax=Alteromonas facilis TaxID=2048004 RepID=UPI000C28937A|nr:histidine phosphatase family protein [Alteromonas facilis]